MSAAKRRIEKQLARNEADRQPPTTADIPCKNTDREIWRKVPGDFYSPSIHVTESGGIGMDVGGMVVVMPIEGWHQVAWKTEKLEVAPGDWERICKTVKHAYDCAKIEPAIREGLNIFADDRDTLAEHLARMVAEALNEN